MTDNLLLLEKLKLVVKGSFNKKDSIKILSKIGRLPKDFDGDILLSLLKAEDSDIRYWAVKNLGKLENVKYLDIVFNLIEQDNSSSVRREAVSTIGRMRDKSIIPYLKELLKDIDPEVVLQVIRALLVFKEDEEVVSILKSLKEHSNEIIKEVIVNELYQSEKKRKIKKELVLFPSSLKDVIINADVEEVFKQIDDESIHLTFTSPPYYNAKDYSLYTSYNEYLDFLERVFIQLHRITKEGRFFILNTSPVIIPRFSRKYSSKRYPIPFDIHHRLSNIGWEFIDDIIWLKPEASVKNRNGGFLQHRKPLAYKPNPVTEYLIVYRKKTSKLIDWNMEQYDKETTEKSRVNGNYETSNVWRVEPSFDKVHSAIFPIELCERVIKFYSYKGDLIFDPFAGIGSVGVASKKLGRYFLLIERDKAHYNKMKEKLAIYINESELF